VREVREEREGGGCDSRVLAKTLANMGEVALVNIMMEARLALGDTALTKTVFWVPAWAEGARAARARRARAREERSTRGDIL